MFCSRHHLRNVPPSTGSGVYLFSYLFTVCRIRLFFFSFYSFCVLCCCSYKLSSVMYLRYVRPDEHESRSPKPHSLGRSVFRPEEKSPEIRGLRTAGSGQHASSTMHPITVSSDTACTICLLLWTLNRRRPTDIRCACLFTER